MSEQKSIKQEYQGQTLEHVIVHDGTGRVLPTVIIIPTVMGVQPLEIGFAERLVGLGYHVVVADLFGRRFTPGVDKEAAFAAMGELRADRAALRDRLLAVVDEVRKRDACRQGPDRGDRLLLRRAVRARRGAFGCRCRRRRQLPWPVRPARTSRAADQGQGRRLSWLGRPDGPARGGGRAGQGTDRGGRRLANPCLWPCRPRFHQPQGHQLGIAGVAYNEAAARRSWASLVNFLAETLQ